MTLKLAVLGTCASEDWIRYQNQREAIDAKTAPDRLHSSLIGEVVDPVECPEDLGDLPEWKKKLIRRDFARGFLVEMAEIRPDVLLVDLLSDARDGVINYRDSWITKSLIFEESAASKLAKGCECLNPHQTPRRYLTMFREAMLAFKRGLDQTLPSCRIILHKARFAEGYLDQMEPSRLSISSRSRRSALSTGMRTSWKECLSARFHAASSTSRIRPSSRMSAISGV